MWLPLMDEVLTCCPGPHRTGVAWWGPASHGIRYHQVCELYSSAGHPHLSPSCNTEEGAGV